ncbi:MAG TPA: RidA family protein [Steroidobacteraceae bacterium]|nr:RidA family protein [Steroidobacteraceae bacterium]
MMKLVVSVVVFSGALSAGCAAAPPARPAASAAGLSCTHRSEAVEKSIGYCQAVRAGDVLYVSGVTADGPMDEAVPKVYTQLRAILESHGLTFADVARENVYAVDLDAFIAQQDVRKPYYGNWLPSATWVQVDRLFLPSHALEVELVAHYPKR